MAYKADGTWAAEDDSVSSGVTKLMGQNSPLMQQAKTQAAQSSNRRGLLNSSMATGAATAAMVNAAIPIASQDASQTNAKNLSAQGAAQQSALQTQQLSGQKEIQAQQLAGQKEIQAVDIGAQADRLAQQLSGQKEIQAVDLQAKKDATAAQIAQQDRQYAMVAIAKAQENYDAAFMNIAKEYNLPEAARNAYTTHLGKLRDSDLNLVEQMYGIDLKWGSTNSGTTTGGTDTLTPGASSDPLIQSRAI